MNTIQMMSNHWRKRMINLTDDLYETLRICGLSKNVFENVMEELIGNVIVSWELIDEDAMMNTLSEGNNGLLLEAENFTDSDRDESDVFSVEPRDTKKGLIPAKEVLENLTKAVIIDLLQLFQRYRNI
eukprot:UN01991